ncbi:hypothetical protein OC846_002887 [Tilletia horrida]|uniref:Uncharacterized protein n=1 Tax=Tilletia horrida TaxID=155126 RepID=A0AAN6JUG9_9BASI|nr:hypothetical protein OC845_002081 [Tilletia horrida]KAK0552483.1 hypothetical protein OC846_002887 [Tilletia horrida]KAK0561106.1 hypothetical protein OC861_005979 [Tilletia horrida]
MSSFSGGSGGWGPGPGPGPGGGVGCGKIVSANPAIALASAVINIATRTIVRAKKPITTVATTRQLSSTASRAIKVAGERPASAAARDAILTRQFSTSATARASVTHLDRIQSTSKSSLQARGISSQAIRDYAGPTLTFAALAAAAAALNTHRNCEQERRRQESGGSPTFAPFGSSRPFTSHRLPINRTQQIHGPGLQLARNFSTGGATANAAQESVSLFIRLLVDDEQKRRRSASDWTRQNGAAAARTPTRRQFQNGTPSHSSRAFDENSIIDFPATRELYFEPTELQSQSSDRKWTHVGLEEQVVMKNILTILSEAGPHLNDTCTVLMLLTEPVSVDHVRLLLGAEGLSFDAVPPDRDDIGDRNPRGGFIDDVNIKSREVFEQLFLYVLSALRVILVDQLQDTDMVASAATVLVGEGAEIGRRPAIAVSSVHIRFNGHLRADVMEALCGLVMLRAQEEGHQLHLGGGRHLPLLPEEVEKVLDKLLSEESNLIPRPEPALGAMFGTRTHGTILGFRPTAPRASLVEATRPASAHGSEADPDQLQMPHPPDSLHSFDTGSQRANAAQARAAEDDSDTSSSDGSFMSVGSSFDRMDGSEEWSRSILRSPSLSSEASLPLTSEGSGSSRYLRDSRL